MPHGPIAFGLLILAAAWIWWKKPRQAGKFESDRLGRYRWHGSRVSGGDGCRVWRHLIFHLTTTAAESRHAGSFTVADAQGRDNGAARRCAGAGVDGSGGTGSYRTAGPGSCLGGDIIGPSGYPGSVTAWVFSIVDRLGAAGVGLLVLLENLIPPIPSEVILPLAGFRAKAGALNVWLVWPAATAGSDRNRVVDANAGGAANHMVVGEHTPDELSTVQCRWLQCSGDPAAC